MDQRTTRYIALLAGNGATLLLITEKVIDTPSYIASKDVFLGLIGLAAWGVATAYLALLHIERQSAGRVYEAMSAGAFIVMLLWWLWFIALG